MQLTLSQFDEFFTNHHKSVQKYVELDFGVLHSCLATIEKQLMYGMNTYCKDNSSCMILHTMIIDALMESMTNKDSQHKLILVQ